MKNWLLRWLVRDSIRQGQEGRTIALFASLYRMFQDEFTEDNEPTLRAYMKEMVDRGIENSKGEKVTHVERQL